jgi:hypothetical protein
MHIGLFDQKSYSAHIGDENNDECAQSLNVADLNQDGKDDLVFSADCNE